MAGSNSFPTPVCRFVNVELCGVEPGNGIKSRTATVLLENPQGDFEIKIEKLQNQVRYDRNTDDDDDDLKIMA
jgi:isoleucyl-tRNA synthetase